MLRFFASLLSFSLLPFPPLPLVVKMLLLPIPIPCTTVLVLLYTAVHTVVQYVYCRVYDRTE